MLEWIYTSLGTYWTKVDTVPLEPYLIQNLKCLKPWFSFHTDYVPWVNDVISFPNFFTIHLMIMAVKSVWKGANLVIPCFGRRILENSVKPPGVGFVQFQKPQWGLKGERHLLKRVFIHKVKGQAYMITLYSLNSTFWRNINLFCMVNGKSSVANSIWYNWWWRLNRDGRLVLNSGLEGTAEGKSGFYVKLVLKPYLKLDRICPLCCSFRKQLD